ncbi:MAG TPA: DEAD/DEAH box helicase, partial [Burkholderiales bacterium]
MRVALDVPLAKLFDYAQAGGAPAQIGDRVVVPFGARQQLGVVIEAQADSDVPVSRMKAITAIRDDAPRLPKDWLELMRFLSGYYQRPLGETLISSLPPRLRSLKPLPRKALASGAQPSSARFVATYTLTDKQREAFEAINEAFGRFRAFLLHGVTGSGKTEVYLHLIARVLERGAQALVLVPEISLTPQLEARFRHAFPEACIAVMHSGLEDIARTTGWLQAARGEAGIVLGTRLGVLAPLPRLSLIVVDEEHDPSFKQQEGLRYSARDAAVYRAKAMGCPVVLGTATPSLESWHNARLGRYAVVELPERAAPGAKLPGVKTIDLRNAHIDAGISGPLWSAIGERLAR